MRKSAIFLFIGGLIVSTMAIGEQRLISNINVLPTLCKQDVETLWVFDIDMVLKQPNEAAFQMRNMKKYKESMKKMLEPLDELEKNLTLHLISKTEGSILVEHEVPSVIAQIQKHHKTIALTASLTGSLHDIQDITLQRYAILKKLGLDFSNSFPAFESLSFSDMSTFRGHHPEFKKGILSSNGEGDHHGKGKVLVQFFKKINYNPKMIIFIDDRQKNVDDVDNALKEYNAAIQYIGIVYNAAENYPSESISLEAFEKAWQDKIRQAKKIVENGV